MSKPEPIMTPEEAQAAEESVNGAIVAVYLARITVRGDSKPLALAKINSAIALAVEDAFDAAADATGDTDAWSANVRVTSERVDA